MAKRIRPYNQEGDYALLDEKGESSDILEVIPVGMLEKAKSLTGLSDRSVGLDEVSVGYVLCTLNRLQHEKFTHRRTTRKRSKK